MFSKKKTTCFLGVLATAASNLPGYTATTNAQVLEEVVVTAQRRAESTQDTPVAITGLSSDALSKLGFESANDVAAQVPNMQVSGPFGDSQPIFAIRGVSMSDFNSNQASPIGVYSDEAYLGAVFSHGSALFDIERLEVLRGPQGTLYGKNTTGGAINIITRTPIIGDEWTGNLKLGKGNMGLRSAEGGIGGTLIDDTLAARLGFKFKEDDGFLENALGGDNMASTDYSAARLTLNWQATENTNIVLKYSSGENNGTAPTPRTEGRADIRGFENANPLSPYETNGFIDFIGYDRSARNLDFHESEDERALRGENDLITELDLAILTVNYEAESFSIVSVSSWYDASFTHQANSDGSLARLLEVDFFTEAEAVSQDLRFVSNFTGPFQIIGGIFYGKEDSFLNNFYEIYEDLVDLRVIFAKPDAAGSAPFIPFFGGVHHQQEIIKETTAAYTQMRFDFTANFGMDIGLRYTRDFTEQPYLNVSRIDSDRNPVGTWVPGNNTGYDSAFIPLDQPQEGPPGYTDGPYTRESAPKLDATEKEWTGKIGFDYRFNNEWMVYTSYSKGYRAGSFNGGIYYEVRTTDEAYANPEFIDAYEIGFKADLLDNSLRINSAVFFYDYTDQQFVNVVGVSTFLDNAGRSEMLGAESEIFWAATDRLIVSLGLGYLKTEYTDLVLNDTSTISDIDDTVDLSGNELISSPKFNGNLSIDYDLLVTQFGYLTLNANASYQGDQWFSAYNDAIGYDQIRQDAYWIYNGRLSWFGGAEDNYQISIWGKNLSDEEYDTYAINLQAAVGYDQYNRAMPRTYGVEIGYRF